MEKTIKYNKSLVSIIVPIFNEEMNIKPFYNELTATISKISNMRWEIIFVDDGCTDRSVDKVMALREADQRVKLLRLSRNYGSHAALMAGFQYSNGDALVIMSVDLQDPPGLIREFVEKWHEGYHMVWGVRESREDPWGKKILAYGFYWLLRKTVFLNYPKGGMDYGIFDRSMIDIILSIDERHGFVFATLLWSGFRQTQIPYARKSRKRGITKWSFARRVKSAIDIIISFSYFPIRIISYLGIVVSFLSFVFEMFLITRSVYFKLDSDGWLLLMVGILFIGGVQLIMLGVLGEYIWRIAEQVRGRPPYLVMEEVGFNINNRKKEENET
jgi:dolichol-phosphate mannosyltransferase|tara:strand:+ start:6319 stop:7305 length:987 start_codon:yes stop_codon:yes gene_type:complete